MSIHPLLRAMLAGAGLLTGLTAAALPSAQHVDLLSEGVTLKATYYSAGKPGPGVVLLHMCNSTRAAWAGLGARLAARGIHAIALDYRGYGDSEGKRSDDAKEQQVIETVLWPRDIDAALAYLVAQAGVDRARLGAAGGSCGVDQALQFAARHEAVKTLVLLAGRTDADGEAFLEKNPWMPIFASASADDGAAVDEMRWLIGFSAHAGNRMLDYPRGGHGTEMFAVHADLEPAIVDWFDEHLVKRPPVRMPQAEGPGKGPSTETAATLRRAGGAATLRGRLRESKAKGSPARLPPEGVINQQGYDLLQKGEAKEALEVFLLNVEAHPQSANTYDSVSDAYVANDQPSLAIEFAEKALAALAADPNRNEVYQKAVRDSADSKLAKLRRPGPGA